MRELVVSIAAQAEIDDILWFSETRHGSEAARRYRLLLNRAFSDLLHDPAPPTSRSDEVGDLRLYSLQIVARRLKAGDVVKAPPHVVVYRFDDSLVEIVRVLHAAMDLPQQLADMGG